MPVAPPTEPAVCTRSSGLPTAPSASARYSSGIITPSNRSGAFPTTTASMSAKVSPASASARSAASRHSPAIDTSVRLARCRVCPTPRTAASALIAASMTQTRFCCSAGPLVACPRARSARPDMTARAAQPIRASPAANIGLAQSAPPDGLTSTVRRARPSPSARRSRIS